MAGVEQFVSLAPTALRAPLANAFEKFGIDTAADLCCIMSCKKDAGKVCLELLGDLYTTEFDDALITIWEASKTAGLGKFLKPCLLMFRKAALHLKTFVSNLPFQIQSQIYF